MAQFGSIRCPVCMANIETTVVPEKCPACKETIIDKVNNLDGSGITTAQTTGPGLKPLTDVQQDVY